MQVGSPPSIAVSATGWVVALIVDGPDVDAVTLRAYTIAPDGGVTRSELAAGEIAVGAFEVDGNGVATVVWAQADAIRTARAAPGGPWTEGRSFAPLAFGYGAADHLSLAVSPSGHTLLAWVVSGNVQASLDGGPPETVATAAAAGSPRAAIDDAGDALIAFGARRGRVLVATRVAGAAWARAREIQGPLASSERNEVGEEYVDQAREISVEAVLAPDGRAVVAWDSQGPLLFGRLVAVAGHVSGAWSAPVVPSSPVRLLAGWTLGLDAGGAPRIAWDEFDDDSRFVTLPRATVLVADAAAPPADRTAPEVTATLPVRAPATRVGELRTRVPVRCSEACDVRLEVGGYSRVRSLPAGRTVKLGVLFGGLASHPGNRRFRVRLTVSDRAGNVVRRASTLRIRVIRRPLRSFKVAPDHDFATCTRGGNRRLGQLVNSIIEGLADGSLNSAWTIRRTWRRGFDAIERAFPDECLGDTDVREHIYEVLDTPLTLAGYPEFYLDD